MTFGVSLFASTRFRYDFSSSITPVVGIGYVLPIARNFGRVFVFPQLRLYSFRNKGRVENEGLDMDWQAKNILQLSLNAAYNVVNKERLRLFLAPGFYYSIIGKNTRHVTDGLQKAEFEEARIMSGILGQAGAIINKHWLVLGSYQPAIYVHSGNWFSATHRNMQLTVGYKF